MIGADWLIYQELDDLMASASEGNPEIKQCECAGINGKDITGDVDEL